MAARRRRKKIIRQAPPPIAASVLAIIITVLCSSQPPRLCFGKLADRSRIVQRRLETGQIDRYHDNGRPIEGPRYRSNIDDVEPWFATTETTKPAQKKQQQQRRTAGAAPWKKFMSDSSSLDEGGAASSANQNIGDVSMVESPELFQRKLSSQLSGCCYDYQSYSANDLCSLYGNDCDSGETPSHDSGDDSCEQDGLSFIGISFSVNTANGNPYSYQLCDQFPMENIIDRDYKYVMSMDEDGWLVGGGYKTFDYSGKMP